MNKIGERIRDARVAADISKSELARIVGVSASAITQWEDGTTKKFDAENLVKAAAAIGTSVQWLLFDGDAPAILGAHEQSNDYPTGDYVRLKLLDVVPHMGPGAEPIDNPEILKHVDVLRSYISLELRTNPERIDLLAARGDSMSGTIENGDVVFVDRTIRRFDSDGIYVIVWHGRLLLKRLHAMMDGRLEIKSDNLRYTPEYVAGTDEESLVICGRVVGRWGLERL